MAMLAVQNLETLLQKKKVIICCGSGGVGKTTTAAALALRAAIEGYKTLVLTIDPAKRLANSLGIQDIDYHEREIAPEIFLQAGITIKGSLYAMMLDTKRTFDDIIRKYSADAERAEAVLNNKLYQHLSNMMAGSQEYMAMEKLYEMVQQRDYDLVVLDTPPSRHALDFLEAPHKMSTMVGDSVLNVFLKPSLFMSRAGLKVIDRSMRRVLQSFDKVAGFEFLQDVSGMLVASSGLLGGFRERAEKVEALLHDARTSFLLIASPQPIPLREAEYFFGKLQENKLPFAGFIFNRVYSIPPQGDPLPPRLKAKVRAEYDEVESLFVHLARRDRQQIDLFRHQLGAQGKGQFFKVLPQMQKDIHDLAGLRDLGQRLFEVDSLE